MTQSQLQKQVFHGASSLLAWAGNNQNLRWLSDNISYVLKDGMYYYFESDDIGIYSLMCESERDLGEIE